MELEQERGGPGLHGDAVPASDPHALICDRRILAKSQALVPEEAVHEALAAISDGAAVAFDLRRGREHYFSEPGVPSVVRLLEGISDLAPSAPARLRELLEDPALREDLRGAFDLLVATVAGSIDRPSLLERRFVILHQGHVLFDAGMILDHAGAQSRSRVGPGQPTIYLPLELLNFVRAAAAPVRDDLRFLLEHADFHLRGNPGAVVIDGHPYSSPDEHTRIDLLWTEHRRMLVDRCRAEMDLLDGGAAAYLTTVLYLLGAIDMVMADTVPVLLQRLETCGDDLCEYIPQMHAAFCGALADAADAPVHFKLILLESVGRSVASILDEHGISVAPDVLSQIDRPSAGVLAIRRTLNQTDLAEIERVVADLQREDGGAVGRAIEAMAGRAGSDDLCRAAIALLQARPGQRDPERLADGFLLNRHEARVLKALADLAAHEPVRAEDSGSWPLTRV